MKNGKYTPENNGYAGQDGIAPRLKSQRMVQGSRAGQRRLRPIHWHCERVGAAYAEIERRTAAEWGMM